MDDAVTMGRLEGIGNLGAEPARLAGRQRAARQACREGLTLQQLHDEEVDALLVAKIEQRADIRMGQLRDDARLAIQPLLVFGRVGQVGGQHLDGHGAIEAAVGGFVDLAHAAGPDQGDDLIGSESGAGGECHGSGSS